MNILAGRCPGTSQNLTRLTGKITLNGQIRNDNTFRGISAYVQQDDNLYPHLTVMETFSIAASFYLPEETTNEQRSVLVDAVISELGLNNARDTIIGDEKVRGVSGGERRRASIGVQLISDPAVLFLDEPTSGLDSFQALSVMDSMKNMATNGRLVVAVIHQPRSSIFNMFDKLLLLTDGRNAFFGESSHSVKYFSGLGYSCPESFNPSDYFLDLLSPDNRSPESETESRNRIEHITRCWVTEYDNRKSLSITNESSNIGSDLALHVKSIGEGQKSMNKRIKNLGVLAWRAFSEQRRDTFTLRIKIILTIFFAFIIGGIYSNIGYSQASIQNRFGLLFFIIINQLFGSVTAVFNTFPREKDIVNRERASHAYDTFSYFAAKVFCETPINVLPSLIYCIIIYWMVGLHGGSGHFGIFAGTLMFTNFVGITLGLAISASAPSPESATAFGLPLLIISILFGGFYIKITSEK